MKLLFYGRLAEAIGPELEVVVSPGSSVGDVRERLAVEHPDAAGVLRNGRALSFVHLLTGATAIGVEIQPELVRAARERAARLRLSRLTTLEGDATSIMGAAMGTRPPSHRTS